LNIYRKFITKNQDTIYTGDAIAVDSAFLAAAVLVSSSVNMKWNI